MRILILVLSTRKDPYIALSKSQKATWDSIEQDNCRTIYYYGGNKNELNGNDLTLNTDDGYYNMHWKLKMTLDYVWDWDWDYVFRTNSSTYIDKNKLYEYILNNNDYDYAGYVNGTYVTGIGIILSRKSCEILKDKLPQKTKYQFPCEDIVLGDILSENNIEMKQILIQDTYNHRDKTFIPAIIYRCKTSIDGDFDRSGDIQAFNDIYHKTQNK